MHSNTLFSNPVLRAPRLRRAPTNSHRYVRRVKGGAWQARVWLGARAGGSLNLGLFTVAEWENEDDAERAAHRASKAFVATHKGELRETIEKLKALRHAGKWVVPADLLPPRVRMTAAGKYVARVKKGGRVVATPGVFACPWECYGAMILVLEAEFPRGVSKSETRAAARVERACRLAEVRSRACPLDLFGGAVTPEDVLAQMARQERRRRERAVRALADRDGLKDHEVAELLRRVDKIIHDRAAREQAALSARG